MQIKSEYDGKEIVIDMPDSEYWIDRAKKRVSAYWSNADNVEKELNKKFLETYKKLEKEFLAFSNKYGKDGVLTYSQKRVVSLILELKPHIDRLYLDEDKLVTDHLSDSYSDNYVKGMYELTSGTSVAFNFAKIDNRAVQAAITYPWSGASFSERIYQNKDNLINVLRQEITSSLIRGDSTQQTARVISDRLDISRRNANMLVQTETAAVITSSDRKAYTDFGIQEYEYEATLDNRTSPICRELDMQVFDVQDMTSGLNAPPMHPRCRSTTVPHFDYTFSKRISKSLKTGSVEYVPQISYKEWEKRFVE